MMNVKTVCCIALMVVGFATDIKAEDLIEIKSKDGIRISADLYKIHPDTVPFIILFHQAGWSRGEYRETAPKFTSMGYNCLAVDLRSGKQVNGVENMTFQHAKQALKQTRYIDAMPDIEAVVEHVKKFLTKGKVILLGSSYSASLVLKYAGEHPDMVQAVAAFSPGEYFTPFGKPSDYIAQTAKNISCPVFITSAKGERNSWWSIFEAIPNPQKQHYLPESAGNHGSRALWAKFSDHKGYWEALMAFVESL